MPRDRCRWPAGQPGDQDRSRRVTDSTKVPTMHPCLLTMGKRVTLLSYLDFAPSISGKVKKSSSVGGLNEMPV
jgi:hypothetical protein